METATLVNEQHVGVSGTWRGRVHAWTALIIKAFNHTSKAEQPPTPQRSKVRTVVASLSYRHT